MLSSLKMLLLLLLLLLLLVHLPQQKRFHYFISIHANSHDYFCDHGHATIRTVVRTSIKIHVVGQADDVRVSYSTVLLKRTCLPVCYS